MSVESNGTPLGSVTVYLFTESGSYLGINQVTDLDGTTTFTNLPEGTYKFRADYQSSHYWATSTVTSHQNNLVALDTGGGSLTMTVFAGNSTILDGVNTYLFTDTGSYLGETAQTDSQGIVSYDVADGSYKIRVDYLGYQYWSEVVTVPETVTGSVTINHLDSVITVIADQGTVQENLEGIRCYLFTAGGSYTGIAIDTDSSGRAIFNVPPGEYKVRADYLGQQHWSTEFNQTSADITILHGELSLHVTDQYTDLEGARVYLFTDSGSYLNQSELTDALGEASFIIPEGSYKVRVDVDGTQHWSETINIIGYQLNQVSIELSELTATNNPRPVRYDGQPPVYYPLLAAFGDVDRLFAQPVVGEPRTYYFISDHLGTGQLLVNDTQVVVWQGENTPFGETTVVVDQVGNSFRFPGQYYDAETGLYYTWNRYYDPQTGRFISADPIGLYGGLNLYAYVNANPINYIDPDGLNPVAGAISGIAIGGPVGGVIGFGLGLYAGQQIWDHWFANDAGVVDDPLATQEHDEYKRRYAEPPPPDLDECEKLRWRLKREERLLQDRLNWDAKWKTGAHDRANKQTRRAIQRLKNQLKRKRCDDPCR